MNKTDPIDGASQETVSCVWPLVLVLTALLVVNGVQLASILQERSAVHQLSGNADQASTRYQLVSSRLKNLAEDLIQLSQTNEEAKAIVSQFEIKMSPASGGNPTETK